jgi:putative ABC transport system permease protein
MLWSTVLLSLREIRRNVMRSFLTILGIVIGVGAVITMVTIGGGATLQVKQQIASMGSNLLMIGPGKRLGPGQSTATVPFKQADVDAIVRDIDGVAAIAPVSTQSMQAILGNQNWSTIVTGSTNAYFAVTNRQIALGRQFTEGEVRAARPSVLSGDGPQEALRGAGGPGGEDTAPEDLLRGDRRHQGKGAEHHGHDQDDMVVIPLAAFQRRIAGNRDISLIQVSMLEGAPTEKAKQQIQRLMRERRHLSSSDDDNFDVMDPKEIATMLTGTTQLLTALLSAVAAVDLLVGGIGIMNIMLVSVTERTREIGIRLAIGALEREVLMQFLVEAVVLSSCGGLLGIILALSCSVLIARMMAVPFVFNGPIVFVAFLFSARLACSSATSPL